MNLDDVSDKDLHALERLLGELLDLMKHAKLHNQPIAESLNLLKQQAGDVRRERFDVADREYNGY